MVNFTAEYEVAVDGVKAIAFRQPVFQATPLAGLYMTYGAVASVKLSIAPKTARMIIDPISIRLC